MPVFDSVTAVAIANQLSSDAQLVLNIANQPDRYALATIGVNSPAGNFTLSVALAGTPMELLLNAGGSAGAALTLQFFGLANPPAGSATLDVVRIAATSWSGTIALSSYYDVDQTTPIRAQTASAFAAATASWTLALAPGTGDFVLAAALGGIGVSVGAITCNAATQLWSVQIPAGRFQEGYGYTPTAGTASVSFLLAGNPRVGVLLLQSPTVSAETALPPIIGAGSGRYNSLGEDFWAARERYLARMFKVQPAHEPPRPLQDGPSPILPTTAPKVLRLAETLATYQAAADLAITEDQRRNLSSKIARLSAKIALLEGRRRDDDEILSMVLRFLFL